MQCLFFIWRPGHHRSSEELQGLGKVLWEIHFEFKIQIDMDHSNILPLGPYSTTSIIKEN